MINIEKLRKLIELALLTSYIEGEKPVSLAIISDRPESGKTELLKKFDRNKHIALVTDATAFGIWRDYHEEISRGEVNHLIFPDFLTLVSRVKPTVGSLITTLNPLIEEGLAEIHTGFLKPIKLNSPRPIGIIIAMVRKMFQKYKQQWIDNGFYSRLLIFSYRYSQGAVNAVFKSIIEGEYLSNEEFLVNFPQKQIEVKCPAKVGEEAQRLTNMLLEEQKVKDEQYGFRMLKDIRRLTMANAILNGRTETIMEDINEIWALSLYFNEKYRTLPEGEEWNPPDMKGKMQ